ncbi:STAS/SEC14 domain-containing protein [Roseovarius spongiae]|uniref:STAS/SEC14 domain-containing protein n=1 Tax=Roseovarius spongiae TaxID=2320272 RepID=A0A3A8AZ33_9RHOB|nr:STAS/SEC14 domain-containing protein [Roseovarius spongiae]RKF16819.1 STAS/SEC14 domain-containing protein [Roseovarius spongiae]
MLSVKEPKPRLYEITLSGVVDRADVETMKRHLAPALESGDPMAIVVRAEDWHDMTGDALIADARFEFGMLPQWSLVRRVAVVTDKQAFEALMRWIDPVLPMIELRTFAPADAQEAETWAAAFREKPAPDEPGVRVVEDGGDGLLIFEIDGRLSTEDADAVFAAFDHAVEAHGKVNLLVRVRDYEGFDLAMLGDRDLMMSKFGAIGKVGRYAIVGAPGWMRAVVEAATSFMPFDARAFDASEEEDARAWAAGG